MPAASRRALLTGLTGQDGSFLAELLLSKGYAVTAVVRGEVSRSLGPAEHLREQLELVSGDLRDAQSLRAAVEETQPDELYHLAAPSFVPDSWRDPAATFEEIASATATLLIAVRELSPGTRVFVASSGAMFGAAPESPQNERTPCFPTSPYAAAKLAAHQLTRQLREHDGMFACSGILFNHESERRPESFVTRKVAKGAAEVKLGLAERVTLGDLAAVRDWSFAGDVMEGAWLMLQAEEPDDYVLASGVGHTVGELAKAAFSCVGLDAGEHVEVDESLLRAPESTALVGDRSRAEQRLRWTPRVAFEDLIARMVEHDVRALETTAGEPRRPAGR